ncbi:hypothetical protein JW865_05630 [Candidatus Bathyarchaeota archaeon]|nr:hypothetical protein [Candidatus Bathyarchaeota archaeon]
MKESIEKCPMCIVSTAEECELMVGKNEKGIKICCCEHLKRQVLKSSK